MLNLPPRPPIKIVSIFLHSNISRANNMKEHDMVEQPVHYQSDTGMQCIDAIRAALGPEGFRAHCRATVIKYLWREKWDTAEDAKKAAWYLNKLVESYEDDSDSTH